MGIPATSGSLKNLVKDMQIGDFMPYRYKASSGVIGTFSDFGTATGTEIPVEGTATPDGIFYLTKVAKGTLIADRVIQTNISYDTINNAGYIFGKAIYNINEIPNVMTSMNTPSGYLVTDLAGGSAYAAWQAFNGKIITPITGTDIWTPSSASTKATPGSASIEMPSAVTVNCLTLSTLASGGQYEPTDLMVYFDNNGTWELCGEMHNNPTGITALRKILIPFTKTVTSKKFKINVWCGSGGWMNIIELTFGLITNSLLISSLTGGCAYADSYGLRTLTNQNKGAFPITNEWDKYIVNSTLEGKITAGDNNVWHNNVWSWTRSVPVDGLVTPTTASCTNVNRILRGGSISNKYIDAATVTLANSFGGFRPIIKYIEPNGSSKQSNLWY